MASIRNAGLVVAAGLMTVLAGCATPDAVDIKGRWRPVNQFAEAPRAIPLQQSYLYQATPADATLKSMLARWAKDSRLSLSYLHPNDYTLHAPVGQIRTWNLQSAVDALSSAYAQQGVQVTLQGSQIVVSQPRSTAPAAEPAAGHGG